MTRRLLLGVCLLLLWASHVFGNEPWLEAPFSSEPQELLLAAKEFEFDEGRQSDTLFHHTEIEINADLTTKKTVYRVWRLKTEEAARDEALVQVRWSPWYQARPKIRARVIRPDGKALEIDPNTISESKPTSYNATILSNDLVLQAPLPGVTAGCLVEEVIIEEDTRPFFKAGTLEEVSLVADHRLHVSIEAPNDVSFRHAAIGLDIEPTVTEMGDMVSVSYKVDKKWSGDQLLPFLPPERTSYPYLTISTGASWEEIAKSYAEIAESRIDVDYVRPVVNKVLTGKETASQAAAKFLIWMRSQSRVRYTGIEFGRAAIVPYRPKETLERGFGDCKDQSTLLVSMMRAAGFDANIALLRSGTRSHIRRDMPGLNAFNHAIVHVGGSEPFWIDPTDPYSSPGALPLVDQNRFALVASKSTSELTMTPKSKSTDNVSRGETTIFVSPTGKHRIQEESTHTGTFASASRQTIQESSAEMKSNWTDYGKEAYGEDATLTKFEHSPPNEFTPHVRLFAEYTNAELGDSGVDAIAIAVSADVFDRLPFFLFHAEEAAKDGKPAGPYSRRRTQPLQLTDLHVSESRFELHIPDGYVLSELPAGFEQSFGPLTLQLKTELSDNVVTVTGRIDTGNGLLTPDQVTSLRAALSESVDDKSGETWLVSLRFNHQAYAAAQRGDLLKAVSLYQAMLKSHPKQVVNYSGLVDSLIHAGQVVAARTFAEEAIATLPDESDSWAQLGYSLIFDDVGRQLKGNFDYAGSMKAYRKCLELNPDHANARYNLAFLLEHDDRGNRYGGDLLAACAEYEKIFDAPEVGEDAKVNWASIRFFRGEFDLLLADREKIDVMVPHISVAIAAIRDGVAAAKVKADELSDSARVRNELMSLATGTVDNGRHYQLAAKMYNEIAWSNANSQQFKKQAELLQRVRRTTEEELAVTDPESAATAIVRAIISYGIDMKVLAPFVVEQVDSSDELAILNRSFRDSRRLSRVRGVSKKRREDAVVLVKWDLEGSEESGYRVNAKEGQILPIYVLPKAETNGTYKVLLSGTNNSELGRYALKLLAEEKLEDAVKWLDWAKRDSATGAMFDAYSGSPFARIWSLTDKKNLDSVRVAATCLASLGRDAKEYVPFLAAAVESETKGLRKTQVERSLLIAMMDAKKYDEAAGLANKSLQKFRRSAELHRVRMKALVDSKQLDKAKAAAEEWKKVSPRDMQANVAMVQYRSLVGDYQGAYDVLRDFMESTPGVKESPALLNMLAWKGMFLETLPDDAFDQARMSCQLYQFRESKSLHTLACILAERGEVADSHQYLMQALAYRNGEKVEDYDWYVVGRNLETLGLGEIAIRAYKRIKPSDEVSSTFELAKRRLAVLAKEGDLKD